LRPVGACKLIDSSGGYEVDEPRVSKPIIGGFIPPPGAGTFNARPLAKGPNMDGDWHVELVRQTPCT
jgi:hypothetical protein